jgi:MFS transporter, SP family, general alpha glucoside:H+ symporter
MATTTAAVETSAVQKVADQDLEEKLGAAAILDAKRATDDEHAQTLLQALSQNRKAVMWSVLISMAIIMEGVSETRDNPEASQDTCPCPP